jgi:hypothetical protein
MLLLQLKKSLICSIVIISLTPYICRAEETPESSRPITFGAELDVNSLYIWRGLALSRGMVLQPSAFVTIHNATLSSWSNYEISPEFGKRHLNETDLTVTYSQDWHNISFEPTVQAYFFPRDVPNPNTAEFILKVRYPLAKPIGVFTRHAFDMASFRGAYFGEAGVDCQKEFGRQLKLSASASAGWGGARFNNAYLGFAKSTLNAVSFDTALSWQVTKKFLIRPHINLSSLVDNHLRKLVDKPDPRSVGLDISLNY